MLKSAEKIGAKVDPIVSRFLIFDGPEEVQDEVEDSIEEPEEETEE